MVKFGKNKLKALNKLAKKQKLNTSNVSNKILKKKQNVEKKVTFQKEVLSQIDVATSPLVKNVQKVDLRALLSESTAKKSAKSTLEPERTQKKIKAVQKQKQRKKTQLSDAKLLLQLMKKK